MEMFELRYFLTVAEIESLNRAAEQINVSPASLSKAIARLEDELQTALFFKSGRGIRLTPEGRRLKEKAAVILQLEEDARFELTGKEKGSLNIALSAEEVLQSHFGVGLTRTVHRLYPQARVQFSIREDEDAAEQVRSGEAHLALITSEPPAGLVSKVIAKVEFQTCASEKHPLLRKFTPRQTIPVEEILQHSFVSPESAILGRIAKATSRDGWRDDKFPRKIGFKAGSVKVIESLIQNGLALGYLPDYLIAGAGLIPLKVSGCPYTCQQTVRLIAKDPSALGWLNRLWDEIERSP